jgi:NAD(P)-dependent dehydrogenase (short-subunit alcohol dehydrogenase family)
MLNYPNRRRWQNSLGTWLSPSVHDFAPIPTPSCYGRFVRQISAGYGRYWGRDSEQPGCGRLPCVRGRPAVATCRDLDDRVEALSLDVSDKESIDRLVAGLNRLDILVNSAGIIRREAEYELDAFEEVIDINLTIPVRGDSNGNLPLALKLL